MISAGIGALIFATLRVTSGFLCGSSVKTRALGQRVLNHAKRPKLSCIAPRDRAEPDAAIGLLPRMSVGAISARRRETQTSERDTCSCNRAEAKARPKRIFE